MTTHARFASRRSRFAFHRSRSARFSLAVALLAAALLASPGCGMSDRQTQRINGQWRTVYTEYGGRKFYNQQGRKVYLDTLPPAAFQDTGPAID